MWEKLHDCEAGEMHSIDDRRIYPVWPIRIPVNSDSNNDVLVHSNACDVAIMLLFSGVVLSILPVSNLPGGFLGFAVVFK
jgi:hypothetical protein